MSQKKNKGLVISIIIVLVLIIILAGIIACIYFFTDTFKSNKQLFFEYTAQIVQTENGFIGNSLNQYFQRKNNTAYENNGDITFEISNDNLDEETVQLANDFHIDFSGKTDPNNKKTEKEVNLIYAEDIDFPFIYKQTANFTGIQTEYIGSSFVAIKNDEDLEGFEQLTNLANIPNIQFSNEEIQNLKTTYFDNILNSLDDSKFTQNTDGDLKGYKLTLTGDEFKNVLVQMLNALQADETTINKINEILNSFSSDTQLNADSIGSMIEDVNDMELTTNIELTVYVNGQDLTRIDITTDGNTLSINKQANEQEATYTTTLTFLGESSGNITFTAKYTGLNSDNINENYELIIEENDEENNANDNERENSETDSSESEDNNTDSSNGTIENNTTNSENTTSSNTTDLENETENTTNEITDTDSNTTNSQNETTNSNSTSEESGTSTSNENTNSSTQNGTNRYQYMITNAVQFGNSVEIEDLTDENAVVLNDRDSEYVTNLMSAIQQRFVDVNALHMEELGVAESENPIQYLIPAFLTGGETTTQVDEIEVSTFNQKFELYESTNTKGATVKGLLTTIQNNNETNPTRQIEEINVDGEEYEVTEQNITLLKSNINVDDDYRVEFERDSDTGLIYRAVINKR